MGTAGAGWSVDDVASDDPDRRSDDCSGEDHCDPVCTSGSDTLGISEFMRKKGWILPGRHETGAVGRKWITEIGKILLQ